MAELDTNTSDLWWLNRKNWLEGPDRTMEGIRLGAQIAQQKRQYALDLVEHSTREKEADVRMHNAMLDQQLKSYQIQDAAELKKAQIAMQMGQEYEPVLQTHTAALTWQSVKNGNAEMQAKAKLDDRYADIISEEPLAALDMGNTKKYSTAWSEKFSAWGDIVEGKRSQRKLAAETAKQELITERMLQVEGLRTDRAIAVAQERAKLHLDNATRWLDRANYINYKERMDAILRDYTLDTFEKKSVEMDKLSTEFGVGKKIEQSPLPASPGLPLPASKKDLIKGKIYQTREGPGTWDGERFVLP